MGPGGSVKLSTNSVFDHPEIDPALMGTAFDQAVLVEAVKAAQRFVASSPWTDYITGPFVDFVNATTDAGIRAYFAKFGTTIRHPVASSKISKDIDNDGVVSPQLLVKKISGVRVVDASIFVSKFHFSR